MVSHIAMNTVDYDFNHVYTLFTDFRTVIKPCLSKQKIHANVPNQ